MGQSAASAVIANVFGLTSQPTSRRRHKPSGARPPILGGKYGRPAKDDERLTQVPAAIPTETEIGLQSAANEARALFGLIRPGNRETVKSVRELIRVPHKEQEALLAFTKANPLESGRILNALRFRAMVLDAFEALAQSAEHAERVAAAEAEAAQRAAPEVPMLPLLHELVVLQA